MSIAIPSLFIRSNTRRPNRVSPPSRSSVSPEPSALEIVVGDPHAADAEAAQNVDPESSLVF
ncbi:hypothetical protein VN24_18190 [Paenibacillus beijingensis]|uniref:Uncharacterized protein n=1 Tax=Paenibacillus beijingensis TaxID=1126833 RepID=A0A0D5NLE4_9BACL|nr:hypothetical protein VN24_18190 [Paenibacillus beijingensis]